MAVQDYTPVMKVLETPKHTICCLKLNLILTIEFELHLGDRRESTARISQKAINIVTLI
jgi:hypothetical protein